MDQRRNRVDLHIHSTASDGALTPSEVVRLAQGHDLSVIALTDHDTLGGVAEAQQAAMHTGLEIVAGLEINSEGEWGDLHFLGYYVDPENESLREKLQAIRDTRVNRARAMLDRLATMGMPLKWEEVRASAAGDSIGRPHVAQALLKQGYVETLPEAFVRFIGNDGPAYVPRLRLTPPEVIQAIRQAGGVPVIAHPGLTGPEAVDRIPEFVAYGLGGVEVYYPQHPPETVNRLLALCREHKLLATGGSDFHGLDVAGGTQLGSVHVPFECTERLRRAADAQRRMLEVSDACPRTKYNFS